MDIAVSDVSYTTNVLPPLPRAAHERPDIDEVLTTS